jgi:hypothetical protein
MTKIEALEREVESLSRDEMVEFRRWFAEFDADLWDRQLEEDVRAGKLDALVAEALGDYEAGECTEL